MLPFDRLVKAIDAWASEHPDDQVVAQIGATQWRPTHMKHAEMMDPEQFKTQFATADLIISHVGMGTIITATEYQKPLVMLPRRASLGEVTSEHQSATAKWLRSRQGISIADTEAELPTAIDLARRSLAAPLIETGTRQQLVDALRKFIQVSTK
jgi:UDP-N-acetylglucosamine transferase subunit ALG13